jgi:hypothetical protein
VVSFNHVLSYRNLQEFDTSLSSNYVFDLLLSIVVLLLDEYAELAKSDVIKRHFKIESKPPTLKKVGGNGLMLQDNFISSEKIK